MLCNVLMCAPLAVLCLTELAAAQPAPAVRGQSMQTQAPQKPGAKRPAGRKALDPIGRPDGQIHDQTARFYVWFDKSGWHVRTTAKQVRRFSGTIRLTEARVKSCLPIGLKERQKAAADALRVKPDRSEVQFAFRSSTASDGFDLQVESGSGDGGEIEFDLAIDDQRNARTVFVGKARQQPGRLPFRVAVEPQKPASAP